jgi:8-oxo-dGTP pyrophosphatase MutT (NUDIX family)
MHYHIYFNDHSYWIFDINQPPPALPNSNKVRLLENPTLEDVKNTIEEISQNEVDTVVLATGDANGVWEIFKQQFTLIQAGGGLVKNEEDEYLFIFRRGKWDLPKGKLDEGETIAECALREVNEETGLQNITLGDHICNTYHTYHEKKKFVLKESVWYHMSCTSGQTLTPQTEEDIVEIKWLKKEDWGQVTDNIFPSIKEVLRDL